MGCWSASRPALSEACRADPPYSPSATSFDILAPDADLGSATRTARPGAILNLAIDGIALLSPSTGIARYTRELIREYLKSADIRPFIHYGLRWSTALREEPL